MLNATEIRQLIDTSREAEKFQSFYSIYLYTMLILSHFPTAITFFLYRHRFKRLNAEFRPIIMHAICTSSFLMTIVSIWQPVAMSPMFGGYSVGLFQYLPPDGFLVGLWVAWTCFAHLGVTFTVAFVLQSYQLKLFGDRIEMFEWLNSDGNSLKFLNRSIIVHALILLVPWASLHNDIIPLSQIHELNEFVHKYPSEMIVQIRGNMTFLFFTCMAITLICLEMITCLLANIAIFRAIRSTSKFVQAKTLQMQMQLYRMLSLQLIANLVLFFIPVGMMTLLIQQIDYYIDTPKAISLLISIMCWHCPAQLIISFFRFPNIRRSSSVVSPMPGTTTKDKP